MNIIENIEKNKYYEVLINDSVFCNLHEELSEKCKLLLDSQKKVVMQLDRIIAKLSKSE